jgi:hypothetical protein
VHDDEGVGLEDDWNPARAIEPTPRSRFGLESDEPSVLIASAPEFHIEVSDRQGMLKMRGDRPPRCPVAPSAGADDALAGNVE